MEAQAKAVDNKLKTLVTLHHGMYISTITALVTLNKKVSLTTFQSGIKSKESQGFIKDVIGHISLKEKDNFHNSLLLRIGKQTIKLFANGNLHITGYKTAKDIIYIGDVICVLLEISNGGSGLDNIYKMEKFKIELVNVCFKLTIEKDQKISLMDYHRELKKYTKYYTSYDTDHYAGVILKAPEYTILTFESGNIIISVKDNLDKIKAAYSTIIEFIDSKKNDFIVAKSTSGLKRKTDFDYSDYQILS